MGVVFPLMKGTTHDNPLRGHDPMIQELNHPVEDPAFNGMQAAASPSCDPSSQPYGACCGAIVGTFLKMLISSAVSQIHGGSSKDVRCSYFP